MASKFTNTLKDTLGIIRALGYRTFIERQWKKPQPMFNVLQVKETEVDLFKEFLSKSLVLSLKFNTPLSLGPFYSEKTKTFIYITHYASTRAYINVCTGLVTSGLSAKRAKATNSTNWTYCKSNDKKSFAIINDIIMVGVDGDQNSFRDYIGLKGLKLEAQVKKIKDIRGKGFSNYYFFKDNSVTLNLLKNYIKLDRDAIVYQAKKLS